MSLVGKYISVQKKMVGRKTTFRLLSEFFFVGKFAVQEFRISRKKRPEEGKQCKHLSGNLIYCRIHRFRYVRKKLVGRKTTFRLLSEYSLVGKCSSVQKKMTRRKTMLRSFVGIFPCPEM